MKVLVTGASGWLGGGVARALAARGDEVTVLQRRPAQLGLREIRADLADAAAVRGAVRGQDAVLHLAAKVDVTGRWTDFEAANVAGTAQVVAACRLEGVPRLVHVSSPSVAHGGASLVGVGAAPADPDRARGSYARSKAAAERLALAADDPTLAVVAIRPHLVWGPGDPQLVARIVARARAGRLPVIGSGAALVDSCYLDNAVDALLAAVDRCGPAPDELHGEALVVSNGEPRPVGELIAGICRAAGVPIPHLRVPVGPALAVGAALQTAWELPGVRRRTDRRPPPLTRFLVEQLSTAHWFDQRRTRALLHWSPRTGLDDGLAALARSYRAPVESRPRHPS